jgi:hypothetical protein
VKINFRNNYFATTCSALVVFILVFVPVVSEADYGGYSKKSLDLFWKEQVVLPELGRYVEATQIESDNADIVWKDQLFAFLDDRELILNIYFNRYRSYEPVRYEEGVSEINKHLELVSDHLKTLQYQEMQALVELSIIKRISLKFKRTLSQSDNCKIFNAISSLERKVNLLSRKYPPDDNFEMYFKVFEPLKEPVNTDESLYCTEPSAAKVKTLEDLLKVSDEWNTGTSIYSIISTTLEPFSNKEGVCSQRPVRLLTTGDAQNEFQTLTEHEKKLHLFIEYEFKGVSSEDASRPAYRLIKKVAQIESAIIGFILFGQLNPSCSFPETPELNPVLKQFCSKSKEDKGEYRLGQCGIMKINDKTSCKKLGYVQQQINELSGLLNNKGKLIEFSKNEEIQLQGMEDPRVKNLLDRLSKLTPLWRSTVQHFTRIDAPSCSATFHNMSCDTEEDNEPGSNSGLTVQQAKSEIESTVNDIVLCEIGTNVRETLGAFNGARNELDVMLHDIQKVNTHSDVLAELERDIANARSNLDLVAKDSLAVKSLLSEVEKKIPKGGIDKFVYKGQNDPESMLAETEATLNAAKQLCVMMHETINELTGLKDALGSNFESTENCTKVEELKRSVKSWCDNSWDSVGLEEIGTNKPMRKGQVEIAKCLEDIDKHVDTLVDSKDQPSELNRLGKEFSIHLRELTNAVLRFVNAEGN